MVAESTYGRAVADEVGTDALVRRDPSITRDIAPAHRRDSQIRRAPSSAGLYDVLDLILDKGIVIDAFVRVSLVGIELVTVDLRVVIASVDTYLRYAEGAERLQLYERRGGEKQLPEMMGADSGAGGMLKKGAKKLKKAVSGDDDDDEGGGNEGVGEKLAGGVRHVLTKGVGGIMRRLSGDESDEDEDDGREREEEAPRKSRRPERERNGSRHAGSKR
jgi:hypothetical protein